MALKKVTVWVVKITGEVTLEAASADEAVIKARKHFATLAESIAWAVEQKMVYVEAVV